MNIQEFKKKEADLDKEIFKLYPNSPNVDGVSNAEKYLNTSNKILFVLKEANDYYGSMRELHENSNEGVVSGYPKWKRSYQKLLYVAHGILTQEYKWNNMSDLQDDGTIDGLYHLDEIGFINLKKECGGSMANLNEVWEYYHQAKEIIKRQIEYLQPTIIINCSRILDFYKDLIGNQKSIDFEFCNYSFNENILVINTYHPNARVNEQYYVDTILEIVKRFSNKNT